MDEPMKNPTFPEGWEPPSAALVTEALTEERFVCEKCGHALHKRGSCDGTLVRETRTVTPWVRCPQPTDQEREELAKAIRDLAACDRDPECPPARPYPTDQERE